ncbi:MAG: hypothetical protein JW384_00279 [Nitrosomonadaceae bacterium]|nr:hypothetical protein [Nitrosomonadaceae bacterium]
MIAITKNGSSDRVGTIRCNNSGADQNGSAAGIIVDLNGGTRFSAACSARNGKCVIAGDFIGSTYTGILCN